MKKLLITGLVAAAMICTASTSRANGTPVPESVAEGVEISGVVSVVTGWQHDDEDAVVGNAFGGWGDSFTNSPNQDLFRFVVDQVEIDLQKSFGENIRLRADLDFVDIANTAGKAGGSAGADTIGVEQAYVTANLAAGNGIELLVGKFNAPVGTEVVDRNENWLISYASPFRFMTPTNVTGAKLYYAFSDLIDWHFAVVNDINSGGFATDSAIPSVISRLGFNWGEEGNESTLGLSAGFGPENANHNAHVDFFGDLDLMIALTDTWTLGGEVVYRQTNSITGGANQKAWAGFLAANYQASDAWDVTFRGDMLWEVNPTGARGTSGASTTGATWSGLVNGGTLIAGTVGAGYVITDGAKLKLEYRFDWAREAGPAADSDYHSVLAELDYTF